MSEMQNSRYIGRRNNNRISRLLGRGIGFKTLPVDPCLIPRLLDFSGLVGFRQFRHRGWGMPDPHQIFKHGSSRLEIRLAASVQTVLATLLISSTLPTEFRPLKSSMNSKSTTYSQILLPRRPRLIKSVSGAARTNFHHQLCPNLPILGETQVEMGRSQCAPRSKTASDLKSPASEKENLGSSTYENKSGS